MFATRTHFDYHNPAAVADLQQWLAEAGLELHGVHAPVGESSAGGRWGRAHASPAPTPTRAARRCAEAERALHIARRIPLQVLVVHLGCRGRSEAPGGSSRDAARRSVEALQRTAEPLGVRIAVEVIPNELSRPGSLVHFVGGRSRTARRGHLPRLRPRAPRRRRASTRSKTVSEHLIATHVHDNRGRADDHLVPFEGTIDWPAALTAVQKVGYDGALMFELAARGPAKDTLAGRATRGGGWKA